jgi:hypothetical protein
MLVTILSCSLAGLTILGNFISIIPTGASHSYDSLSQFESKHPFIYQTSLTVELERSPWNGSQTLIDAVSTHQPTRFRSPSVADWPALKWDFWELSSRWSILLDVLVLNQPLFIFSEVDSLVIVIISLGWQGISGTG